MALSTSRGSTASVVVSSLSDAAGARFFEASDGDGLPGGGGGTGDIVDLSSSIQARH
ncbi:hypothetical protein HMPREF1861_00174 [Corynebacterium kroppenstedtii]|nr:hypothetical protein HMPREF1861_00174 [Corynebacterium kroppenstedtii]